MSEPPNPVLMSADNPEGWRLEDLLSQLRDELQAKCARIGADASFTARRVLRNNRCILDLLSRAEHVQRDTVTSLDALRPDPGPSGPPRIGAGATASEA